jgi:hypothetical protein
MVFRQNPWRAFNAKNCSTSYDGHVIPYFGKIEISRIKSSIPSEGGSEIPLESRAASLQYFTKEKAGNPFESVPGL